MGLCKAFCGLDHTVTGYELVVVDVPGNVQRFHLDIPSAVVTPDGLRALAHLCNAEPLLGIA